MYVCGSKNLTVPCGNVRLLRNGFIVSNKEVFSLYYVIPLNLASMFLAAAGNGLVCYTIATQRRFRHPSNVMLAGLASTDFLVGIIVQPLYISHLIASSRGTHSCVLIKVLYYLSYVCVGASLLSLLLMTLERWTAILFPFKHENYITAKKCYGTIVAAWVMAVSEPLPSTLGLFSWRTQDTMVTVVLGLMTVLIITCYSMIFTTVRRHRKRINASETDFEKDHSTAQNVTSSFYVTDTNTNTGPPNRTLSNLEPDGLISPGISRKTRTIYSNHVHFECERRFSVNTCRSTMNSLQCHGAPSVLELSIPAEIKNSCEHDGESENSQCENDKEEKQGHNSKGHFKIQVSAGIAKDTRFANSGLVSPEVLRKRRTICNDHLHLECVESLSLKNCRRKSISPTPGILVNVEEICESHDDAENFISAISKSQKAQCQNNDMQKQCLTGEFYVKENLSAKHTEGKKPLFLTRPKGRAGTKSRRVIRRTLRWRKEYTIGIIILMLFLCYLPKVCEGLIFSLMKNKCEIQCLVSSWINTMVYLNSSANFLVYSFRDKQLLRALPFIGHLTTK